MISRENIEKHFPGLEEGLYEELLQQGEMVHVKAGETLLRFGETIRSIILITGGLVKLYRADEHGTEFFLYNLEAGQACSLSMVCAVQHERSELMALALTDTDILKVPLSSMESWMKVYPSWYRFVLTSYRERFEEVLRTVDAIAFRQMDDRLEDYLRRQIELLGNPLRITHQDIARDLNSSREVISRLLKKMEEKDILHVERQAIYLH
ncbi:MAG: Crp/Fnr family transcriptional regulator [Ferruginibacter sp.]